MDGHPSSARCKARRIADHGAPWGIGCTARRGPRFRLRFSDHPPTRQDPFRSFDGGTDRHRRLANLERGWDRGQPQRSTPERPRWSLACADDCCWMAAATVPSWARLPTTSTSKRDHVRNICAAPVPPPRDIGSASLPTPSCSETVHRAGCINPARRALWEAKESALPRPRDSLERARLARTPPDRGALSVGQRCARSFRLPRSFDEC